MNFKVIINIYINQILNNKNVIIYLNKNNKKYNNQNKNLIYKILNYLKKIYIDKLYL